MRKAVIDMGTNTFNLLIADVSAASFTTLFTAKEPVLLGMGGINQDKIAEDAMARALATIDKFVCFCDEFLVQRKNISAIGTSAIRGATNSKALVEKVKDLHRVKIKVISGEEEAGLIYKGVQWTYPFEKSALIMDIGGGSTEFIHANADGIRELVSLNIGVSRVHQQFNHPVRYSKVEQAAIRTYFMQCARREKFSFSSDVLIGASGSFETFYEMIYETYWIPRQEVVELPIESLLKVLNWAIHSTQIERNEHMWITQIRKTMLPIAAIQIMWAIEQIGCKQVYISPYSLKEGALH